MNNKSRLSIFFFLFGALLCLLPVMALPWIDFFGIEVRTASELIPTLAKVDQHHGLQLEMPIYLIRQSFVPFFTELNPIYTYLITIIAFISLSIFLFELKKWSKIPTKQFVLGLGIWLLIMLYKLFPFHKNELIHTFGNLSLVSSLSSFVSLSILSSQAIPHLILQFGKKQEFRKTKRNYSILYAFFIIDLLFGLYIQNFGNTSRPEMMVTYLCLQWAIFWFQIVSNPILTHQKWFYTGVYLLAVPGLLWFLLHQNDAAIRFAFEWNFHCTFIMAFLFPAFIYSNFKEIFTQNLALHTVIFKAHRINIYLYQVGVLIIGLAWTFAKNASLFHVFLAGYYNQIGDIEQLSGKPELSKISYQMAQSNSRLNLKSNFELSKSSASDEEKAQYLNYTLTKRPHPFTYISLGNIYKNNDHAFQALFTFQEGFEKFPESAELATSVAIQFEKLNQPQDALKYYQMAANLDPKNASLFANSLYAQANITQSKVDVPEGFEDDLGVQANRLALYLLQQKSSHYTFDPGFQMQHNVQHFAYLYNAALLLKKQMPVYNFSNIQKNEALNNTFPELKLLEAWQNYYHEKPLLGLDQLSLIVAQDTTAKTQGLQNILGFWKEATLNSESHLTINNLATAQQALAAHPFTIKVLQKAIPILNTHHQQLQAYQYTLAALRYNENIAAYYPIYAMQALELSEITYAKEAMESLKKLDLALYVQEKGRFDKKFQEVVTKQKF